MEEVSGEQPGRLRPQERAPVRVHIAGRWAVITVYAVAGWDPLVQLFFWGGTGGGYGVLLLITATSIGVIVYFTRDRHGENIWRRLIAPVLAAVALLIITWLATANFHTLLGVAPDSLVRWIIPGGYLCAAVLGIGWALILKVTRPQVYARIGMGAKAATTGLGLTGQRPAEVTGAIRREPTR